MKKGWNKYNLMDICNVSTGKHDANHAVENGKYRFYTCSSQYVFCNTKRFEGECIILPGNGVNVGETYYYNGDFDAYQRTYVIDKIDNRIIPMFLYYHFQNNWRSEGVAKQYGSATNYIKIGNFKDYIVNAPQSLSEQQSIVDYLDSSFAKIDAMKVNAEKALNEAKALFQASLKEMLEPKEGWEEKKLQDVARDFSRGKSKHRPRNDKKLFGGKYPFIQTGEIRNSNVYVTSHSSTYNELGLSQSKLWPEDTVCITIAANIAEVAILKYPSCFPDSVIGFVADNNKVDKLFVYYSILNYQQELKKQGKGSAQDNINLGTFEKNKFPFPSLQEQQSIVATLDSIKSKVDRLQENFDKISQECDALKQAILRQVFE